MNEYQMMIHTPRILFDYYLSLIMSGQSLSLDQQIKFAYLKTIYLPDEVVENGD